MTHEELRPLLADYAAGALDGPGAEAVRAHLASGCTECMREVFARPVGLPRTSPEPPPPIGLARPLRAGASGGLIAAVVILAVALAALAAWTIAALRDREDGYRDEAASLARRLTEAEVARAALAERAEAVQKGRTSAENEAALQAEAARASAEETAQIRRTLEAAESRVQMLLRGVQRRDSQIDRLLGGGEEQQVLRELVATPGVEVLHLAPVGRIAEARGHVLWHPARERVLVYVFDLPRLPAGASYHVRLRLDDGAVAAGPTVRPGARGDAIVPIALGVRAARLRQVEVLRDPSAEPVLAGRTSTPAG